VAGVQTLTVELPPSSAETLTLKLACKGWTPSRLNPAAQDERVLGAKLTELTMRAKSAGARVFQANQGEWK
jgi:hypothetical protein